VSPAEIDAFCLGLKAATGEIQWETDRVFKVGGKMFAVLGPTGTLSFKVNDIAFEMLTETGAARPAPYMARAKWVFLDDPVSFDDADLKAYLAEAHAIIAERLTRKQKAELGLG
jgi:predicted DNA-binding protein (MmcQ/YjbR family)